MLFSEIKINLKVCWGISIMDYNITICDDEAIQGDVVERMVQEGATRQRIETKIYKFLSGKELIRHLDEHNIQLHVAFLDMEMEGMGGIELARAIKERCQDVLIIFVTGYRDYVFDVFELGTFRYLLKPVQPEIFFKAFEDAIEVLSKNNVPIDVEFLIINKNKEKIMIKYSSIQYLEKYKNKILVKTDNEDIEFYGTFSELNHLLEGNTFIKVHQGYIANMDKIELITSKEVLLKDGSRIPVSRRNAKEVRENFLNRLRVSI